ncbi:23 kDa integral membrane protein [Eurytemora carolleeae]|uniref:23 kDa integral membrane protein n=1 Tax=Eurytemora carolleeae TaxID=1294199 RepID=UPI000C766291|nr:23 kDa integral membrane protein [Eurytemora carolleeae]XP_023349666.1 23 kDa integral membrane protein [Eurytemora carolleeae]XP_023349667.1 23 kDa integral membrane protein [Eurytemora carolleeae]|eukprot:XP_023349665.1 23 kDa integral membrane protein-like [Eurytemora affinis]
MSRHYNHQSLVRKDPGRRCVNCTLIVINLISMLLGMVLIAIGLWLLIDSTIISDNIKSSAVRYVPCIYFEYYTYFLILGIICEVAGTVILVFSFCGCCGACKDVSCMICTYTFFIIFVVILIMGGAFTWLLFKPTALEWSKSVMIESTTEYNPNIFIQTRVKENWDMIHSNYKCCGVLLPSNSAPYMVWFNNARINPIPTYKTVPESCCPDPPCYIESVRLSASFTKNITYRDVDTTKVYSADCFALIVADFEKVENIIKIVFIVTCVLIIFYFICIIHCKCMNNAYSSALF